MAPAVAAHDEHRHYRMTIAPEKSWRGEAHGLAGDALAMFCQYESELGAMCHALVDKPDETATSTIAALWHVAAGRPMSVQQAGRVPLPALDADAAARLRELVTSRLQGVPLAHLTGWQQFMGIDLLASAGALIPRAETELLGYAALAQLRAIVDVNGCARVIDVCTGSGNLAVALACHEPRARVWGADLSADAVALAQRNATQHHLTDRVTFLAGDLLAPFNAGEFLGAVDLLVCNPPYISSGKVDTLPGEIIGHEPRLAFDGGPLGIRVLQRLIDEAPHFLRAGGWLAVEVGLGQGRGMKRRIERHGGYHQVREIADECGEVRALLASRRFDSGCPPAGESDRNRV